jgi:hypothetical protein
LYFSLWKLYLLLGGRVDKSDTIGFSYLLIGQAIRGIEIEAGRPQGCPVITALPDQVVLVAA